jgi:tetratricopeptide (TPR) repeat protein
MNNIKHEPSDNTSKLFFLLEELKENFSEQLLDDTRECLDGEVDIEEFLGQDKKRLSEVLNGQHERFYDFIALPVIEDLNEFPEMYFIIWESFIDMLDVHSLQLFNDTAIALAGSSDAKDYLEGIKHLKNNNPELALYNFSNIDNYVANYFIGLCYLELSNYENAIKSNLVFLDGFIKVIENSKKKTVDALGLSHYDGIRFALWNLYNDLGYLHNRTEEYEKALLYYNNALEIFDIEFTYDTTHEDLIDKDLSEFQIWINNYLHCLKRNNEIVKAIEIVNFAIEKYPLNEYYRDLKDTLEKPHPTDDILKKIYAPRRPFNIHKHEQVRLLSKERSLEEMLIEQMKYGMMVFNRPLEVYNEDFFGKQYAIKGGYGVLDLLLVDKSDNSLYVVELKRNTAGEEVIAQVERYIEGLTKQLNRVVKGIICLHKPNDALKQAIQSKPHIELYTYQFDFLKQ